MATHDPHSYADLTQGQVTDIALRWFVDFASHQLRGSVRLELNAPGTGPLDLDTRDLQIVEVTDAEGRALPWQLGPSDPVLGQRLRIERPHAVGTLSIRYATDPAASGLMWLDPEMTDGGVHPFLLSQCQAIHARSLVPLQDTPAARLRYNAEVSVPRGLSAVMSAAPATPGPDGARRSLCFSMPQPIPPYLLAIAVGELASRDLGPRTRVFAEPGVVEAAAWEFDGVEAMLQAAEGLFGPYPWERYDFIVLPPAFPMGGMENPRMTFLTPTLLAGDRSLVSVLAHELAHSWTGNLVTNASNEDFWLNEGWTVYAERRILELLLGAEAAAQDAILGRAALEQTIAERSEQGRTTALCYPQQGLDPDDEFSLIPYEKGCLLISALEQAVGREHFDRFVQAYLERFRFQSIPSATFINFVEAQLPGHGLDLQAWVYQPGLPADAPRFSSARLDELAALAAGWSSGARPRDPSRWRHSERLYFLQQLPDDADCAELDALFQLSSTRNAELLSVWLARAIRAGHSGVDETLTHFIGHVGRTKLLKPVFVALMARDPDDARARYDAWAAQWHGSTRLALERVLAGD